MTEITIAKSPTVRLREICETALTKHGHSAAKAHPELLAALGQDPALVWALFGITPALVEQKALQYLRDLASDLKPAVKVEQHIRRPRGAQIAARNRQATFQLRTAQAAKALMVIDGVDIRDWTIGQCLTAARRKGHEAYVLRVIGNRWRHDTHSKTVGSLMNDADIASIVEQGRAEAERE